MAIDYEKLFGKPEDQRRRSTSGGIDYNKLGFPTGKKKEEFAKLEEQTAIKEMDKVVQKNIPQDKQQGFWGKWFGRTPDVTKVDPELEARLRERDQFDKLLELKQAEQEAISRPKPEPKKKEAKGFGIFSSPRAQLRQRRQEQGLPPLGFSVTPEGKQVFEIGEGLEGEKVAPFAFKSTLERLEDPRVREELAKGEAEFVGTEGEARVSRKIVADDVVQEQIERQREIQEDVSFIDKSPIEKASVVTQMFVGDFIRLIESVAVETGSDEFVPVTPGEIFVLGDDVIRKRSDSLSAKYGTDFLVNMGIPEDIAKNYGLGGSIALGFIIDIPFSPGLGGKLGKEGAEKAIRKRLIKNIEGQLGKKLPKESLELLEKEVAKIAKIADPLKQAEEFVRVLGKFSDDIDVAKIIKTEGDAAKGILKKTEIKAPKVSKALEEKAAKELGPLARPVAKRKLPALGKKDRLPSFTKEVEELKFKREMKALDIEGQKIKIETVFDSAEMELGFQRFLDMTKKMKKILDEQPDASALKKLFPDQNLDRKLFEGGEDLTNNEILDRFYDRAIKIREAKIEATELRIEKRGIQEELTKARGEKAVARKVLKDVGADIKKAEAERFDKKVKQILTEKDIVKRRRGFIRAARDHFGLSDADMRKISAKDPRLMSNIEFKKHIDGIRDKAMKLATTKQAKAEVLDTIRQLELVKTDNFRKAMKLPPLNKMSLDQLDKFNEALTPFTKGDEFLSQRLLETIEKTELKGVKTIREVKEWLSKKTGASIEELESIKATFTEQALYDTALAEKNPFYKLLVDEFNKHDLQSAKIVLDKKEKINKFVNAARKSKKRSLTDRLIPTDELVFNYLEADDVLKKTLAEKMTKEELDLSFFLQNEFSEMRDSLVEQGTLNKWIDNYVTHRQRGFLEALKNDGVAKAFGEVFQKNKLDQETFNIIGDTGNILPLEKFFGNAMKRTGRVNPTKNVADAYMGYVQNFQKKQALDAIIPEMMAYTTALNSGVKTPKGLLKDPTLENFVKDWLNGKKGRVTKGVLRQGSRQDRAVRGLVSLTSFIDLGFSPVLQPVAKIGETYSNFVALGAKKLSKGKTRRFTVKGKKMVKEYENLVGEEPLMELLTDATQGIGSKAVESAFIGYRRISYTANKDFFLGSLTKSEWEKGVVSPERLAEMKRLMGKYRVVDGANSVLGRTALAAGAKQYKTWAIPHLLTTKRNLETVIKTMKEKGVKAAMETVETRELLRATLFTGAALVTVGHVESSDSDDVVSQLIRKAEREALTLFGVLDPELWSAARTLDFVQDLASALKLIAQGEKYKTRDELKGVAQLKKTLTPGVVKQFGGKKEPKKKAGKKKRTLPSF